MAEVELEQVSYAVGRKPLLQPTSLSFEAGTVTAILGPNGAGKTTLMRVAAGRLRPRSGAVRYGGRPIDTIRSGELALRRGFLSQHVELAFSVTVGEVVMMGRYPHFGRSARARDQAVVDEALALVGMCEARDRFYPTLSGGEQQKVQLARVLAQIWSDDGSGPPRTLFLDEPIASLDVRYQLHILHLVRVFAARNCAVVMTLHDLNLAAAWADRMVFMRDGVVVDVVNSGSPIEPGLIERVFDVRATSLPAPEGGELLQFHLKVG